MTHRSLGHLINLFFMTNRSLHKHLQAAKIVTTLSFLQFIALKYVLEEGPVRMKDIRALHVHNAGVRNGARDAWSRCGACAHHRPP